MICLWLAILKSEPGISEFDTNQEPLQAWEKRRTATMETICGDELEPFESWSDMIRITLHRYIFEEAIPMWEQSIFEARVFRRGTGIFEHQEGDDLP